MRFLYMMGDSTMRFNKITRYPQTGWGQALELFVEDDVHIFNHAENGRSTKSFIDEKRFDAILNDLKKGDYVICQFGHNDEKIADPLRYTTPEEYAKNLKYFADEVEKKGANIIFATPITRHSFVDGVLSNTHLGYPQAMLDFAKETNHICIDLNKLTINLYNKLGEEETKKFHMIFPANVYPNYMEGKDDHSHLVPLGARTIAELFVRELKKFDSAFNEIMIDLSEQDQIDWEMLID